MNLHTIIDYVTFTYLNDDSEVIDYMVFKCVYYVPGRKFLWRCDVYDAATDKFIIKMIDEGKGNNTRSITVHMNNVFEALDEMATEEFHRRDESLQ